MSLAHKVLQFTSKLKAQPSAAADRQLIEAVERAARASWEGAAVAMMAPVAPETWEMRVALRSADLNSERKRLAFTGPVEIIAFRPVITQLTTNSTKPIPTLDDVDIAIDVDQGRVNFGASEGAQQGGVGSGQSQYVTLSHYSGNTRLMFKRLDSVRPEIGMTVRWKRVNVHDDVQVSLGVIWRPITN